MEQLENIHPGEIIQLDFLEPLNLTISQLADDVGLSHQRVLEIVQGQSPVTLDIALRLGRYFRTTPQLWLRKCVESRNGRLKSRQHKHKVCLRRLTFSLS